MKKELGRWILDVTKYITTVGLIAPFLTHVNNLYWYIGIAGIVVIALLIGLYLAKDNEVKPKKNRRN